MLQVSLKPSQLMGMSIVGWFIIIEVQFNLKKVTAEDKNFYIVVSTLPPDIVMNLPASVLQIMNN